MEIDAIYAITGIDPWFLHQIARSSTWSCAAMPATPEVMENRRLSR
jgi:hypothetical protein